MFIVMNYNVYSICGSGINCFFLCFLLNEREGSVSTSWVDSVVPYCVIYYSSDSSYINFENTRDIRFSLKVNS